MTWIVGIMLFLWLVGTFGNDKDSGSRSNNAKSHGVSRSVSGSSRAGNGRHRPNIPHSSRYR